MNWSGFLEILPQTIASGLIMGLVYSLIAVGLSLIYGLMDIVNFAHGEYMMLAMYAAFFMWSIFSVDPLLSIIPLIAIMAVLGVLTYKGIIRPILGTQGIAQIFATYGLMVMLRGAAQFFFTSDFRTVVNPIVSGRVQIFGIYIGTAKIVAAAGALITLLLLAVLLNKTKLGLAVKATAFDRRAAELMGINTESILALGWAIGIGCTAIAGSLLVNFNYVNPMVGSMFGILAFVAVALGGFGNLVGAFIGALLIGLVEAVGGVAVGSSYKYALVFGLYLVAIMLKPQGLFGKK